MIAKRYILTTLALTMAASLPAGASADFTSEAPAAITAQTAEEEPEFGAVEAKFNSKFGYTVNADGSIAIIDLSKKAISADGTVKFPSKIDGRKVTRLSERLNNAFYDYHKRIKVLDIPASVKTFDSELLPPEGYQPAQYRSKVKFDLKIKCRAGSAAERYAARHNMDHEVVNAPENYVKAVRINKAVKFASGKAKISWEKVKTADGYLIYEFDYETGRLNKLAAVNANRTSYCVKKCGDYVIRAYRKSGGKTYLSADSTVKSLGSWADDKEPVIHGLCISNGFGELLFETLPYDGAEGEPFDIQVYDPDLKKWSKHEICYVEVCEWGGEDDSECYGYEYSLHRYRVKDNGLTLTKKFKKGKKYKVRIRSTAYIIDVGVPEKNEHRGYYDIINKASHYERSSTYYSGTAK